MRKEGDHASRLTPHALRAKGARAFPWCQKVGGPFAPNSPMDIASRTACRKTPCQSSAMISGPDGGKTPRKGVEKAVFLKSTTWIISAQLLCQHTVKLTVASHESQGRIRRKFKFYINLRRKPSSPNFCQKPENVASRSMLAPRRVGSAVPNSARGINGGPRRFTEVAHNQQSLPVVGSRRIS